MATKKGKEKAKTKAGAPEPAPEGKAEPDAEPDADDAEDEAEQQQKGGGDIGGGDISKVTDYAEEREIDSTKASRAAAALAADDSVDREAERARERELAKVSIEQADVELIAREMELDKEAAELALRQAGGDVVAAHNTLVQQPA